MFLFAPLRWALKLGYFAVLAAAVYVVVSAVQVVSASHLPIAPTAVRRAQAIVVLGGSSPTGAQPPDLSRLEQAHALYASGRAPEVLVAGAPARPGGADPTAAEQRWLAANGVPVKYTEPIRIADGAAALAAVDALLGPGAKVVVVTDAIDALWTKGAAARAGLAAQISPAVGSELSFYREFGALWRQATGVAVGRLIGYSHTPWAAR